MFKSRHTLSFRLTAWFTATFVTIFIIAIGLLYFLTNSALNNRINDDLIDDIEEFRTLYNKGGISELRHEIINEILTEDMSSEFIRILDENGDQIFSSDLSHWKGLHTIETVLQRAVDVHPKPILETVKFRDQEYKTRIIYGLIAPNIIAQLGESTEEKQEIMELLPLALLPLFFIMLPFASFIGWLVARQAVKDIQEVSDAVLDIEKGEFDRRVTINSKSTEIQILANTFNNMAARIRSLINEMREMIDNIAHDMRSPVGRIRAISEGALSSKDSITEYQSAAADTLEECDRLIQMINTTLDVAETEAGVGNMQKQDINVSELVEGACELFSPAAEEKNIDLTCQVLPNRHIQGNEQNILRMLANLLDNALKYTPENGKVTINLTNNPQTVRIAVKDSGIGIPKSEHNRVFDRFYRCDSSRTTNGCGLGLSFSIAVARAHNGDITLESSPNIGSTFTITLPK